MTRSFWRGEVAQRVPKVRGKVMAKKAKTGLIAAWSVGPPIQCFEGKFQPPGMDEDTAFESATDGKMFTPSIAQKYSPRASIRSPGALRAGSALLMREYVHLRPSRMRLGRSRPSTKA